MTIRARREVSEYSLMLHDAGWVANHDGNVSLLDGSRFYVTPTAVSKRVCDADSIVECDLDGKPIGKGRPPSEVALHAAAYRARPDVRAVIHAHPPHASAFALAGRTVEPVAMPEVVVSLGDRIPLVALFVPKDPGAGPAVAEALAIADVALMAGNGAIAVGPDLETAYLRMEVLEHYAKMLSIARDVGGVSPLPDAVLKKCLELRKAAGLLREAPPQRTSDVRQVVLEEVRRALGEKK
jgi:L-fuculose-phosphate aldolase